jgi:hypothetical protein
VYRTELKYVPNNILLGNIVCLSES